jgi:fatty-acyl-CoA synthase
MAEAWGVPVFDQVASIRRRLVRIRWTFRSARILRHAGLVRPAHPVEIIRLRRDRRQRGPVVAAVRHAARRWPDELGLVDDRGGLTFGELDRRSNALAWAWRGRGIRQDSAVGMLCSNHRGLVDAIIAAAKLGAQVVLLDTRLDAHGLANVVQREGVTVLVYDQEFRSALAALPARVDHYLAWADGSGESTNLDELIVAAPARELPVPAEPGGVVTLTGLAGVPRGVPWRGVAPVRAAQFLDRIPLRSGGVTIIETPVLRHGGLVPLVVSLALGSTVVLQRRFDPRVTLERIERCRGTALVLTPAMLDGIARHAGATWTVRIIVSTGGVIPSGLAGRVSALFGDIVHNWYGTSECPIVTVATPDDRRAAPGTVGRAPLGFRVRVDGPHGKPLGPARPGAVYVRNEFGTDSADELPRFTGDLGYLDRAGRLFLLGRAERTTPT